MYGERHEVRFGARYKSNSFGNEVYRIAMVIRDGHKKKAFPYFDGHFFILVGVMTG